MLLSILENENINKLDYGSGQQPRDGFKSSDFIGTPNYDYHIKDYKVLDVEDKSFGVLNVRNVIHHIPEKDLDVLFSEFDRLLQDDGLLIISEPRKEYHKQNLILDIIWYRFVTRNDDILIPYNYVDYKTYLENHFDIIQVEHEFQNEILYCKKKGY